MEQFLRQEKTRERIRKQQEVQVFRGKPNMVRSQKKIQKKVVDTNQNVDEEYQDYVTYVLN